MSGISISTLEIWQEKPVGFISASSGPLHWRVFTLSLSALLRSEGHTVEFVKTPDRDDVELVVHGETIYCCKIQDLQYGKSISYSWFPHWSKVSQRSTPVFHLSSLFDPIKITCCKMCRYPSLLLIMYWHGEEMYSCPLIHSIAITTLMSFWAGYNGFSNLRVER